jgi:hypothetical protein
LWTAAQEKIGERVTIWIIFRMAALKEDSAGSAAGRKNAGRAASGSATGRVSARMMPHEHSKQTIPNSKQEQMTKIPIFHHFKEFVFIIAAHNNPAERDLRLSRLPACRAYSPEGGSGLLNLNKI